jgi:hypothetical protein
VLTGQAYHPGPEPFVMSFERGEERLGRNADLALLVRHGYRFDRDPGGRRAWRVVTVSYAYQFVDPAKRMILAYHWHPMSRSPVTHPHLHVGCRIPPFDLSKAHLPTGFVTLPAVVRLTITDLGVEPLRSDWREILDRAEQTQTR